jgi:hypothetical protein
MKTFLTLLLSLFVLQTFASVKLVKNFQINEKLFETVLKQKTESLDIQTFLTKMEQLPIVTDFPHRLVDWKQCQEIAVIGNTCIEVYYDVRQLKVGVRLSIRDRILLDKFIEAEMCLDEVTLMKLITFIPHLLPFKPVIDRLIELYGFIPANVFSICIQIKNLVVSKTEVTGNIYLNSKIMCINDNCLLRGEKDFGKFSIDIPSKK